MKNNSIVFLACLFSTFSAFAVEIKSAKLDANKENLIVTVVHGGGCGDHKYELVLRGCGESMPVQCQATIKHMTADFCEAILVREAKFELKKYGLTSSYYKNASMTITGDNNSSASVILSSKNAGTSSSSAKIKCQTHTGSDLKIFSDSIELVTTSSVKETYKIVNVRTVSLESLPPIESTTYKMDDGRSVKIDFRDGSNRGSGNFIRLDGSYSPEFVCFKL